MNSSANRVRVLATPHPAGASSRRQPIWWFMALVLSLAALQAARAADAPSVASAGLQAGRSYVVMPGDTLDKVVQKTMAGSPLKNEFLREALIAANPRTIAAGRNPRLTPGTVLQLPDHEEVLRKVLTPLLPPAETVLADSPAAGETRRRWVRFP